MIKDISIDEFRWPRKGDRLIRATANWDKGVTFSDHAMARDVHIWSGYMHAGAVLIGECARSSHNRHDLVYPILFNYRHGLEVAIKWILDRYGRYANVQDYDKNHNLWQLWRLCKAIIIEVGGEDDAIVAVEQVIKDFHELDASSFAFRYSTDKNGAVIKLPDAAIDLENVKDVMEGVSNFFGGADGQLNANSTAADWAGP